LYRDNKKDFRGTTFVDDRYNKIIQLKPITEGAVRLIAGRSEVGSASGLR
jgi:hypothetical protein